MGLGIPSRESRWEIEASLLRRDDYPHFAFTRSDVESMDDDEIAWWLKRLNKMRKDYVPPPRGVYFVKPPRR